MTETPARSQITRRYLFRTFLVSLAVVMAALVALSAVFYRSNRSFLQESVRETNELYVADVARLLNDVFFRASYASAAIARRGAIAAYLDPGQQFVESESEAAAQTLLSVFVESNRDITSVVLYAEERDRIVTDRVAVQRSRFADTDWISGMDSSDTGDPILVFRRSSTFNEPILSVLRRIFVGGEPVGALAINMNVESLRRLLGEAQRGLDEDILILREDGTILFSFDDALLGTERPDLLETDNLMAVTAAGSLFNLTYVAVRGQSLLETVSGRLFGFLGITVATVLIAGLGVALILSNVTYRPIRAILDTIQHPERHTLHPATGSQDEISFIEETVLQYVASNRELQDRLAERYAGFQRAHYAALQLQMNPHFLHNTLESMYWWSLENLPAEAVFPKAVGALSRFLRGVLSTDAMAVPMQEERQLTEDYIEVLQLRFPGKLEVRWSVPTPVDPVLVPKLVLQPLVENAFYHGIKPLRRAGVVEISAVAGADRVELRVRDNGVGIDTALLAKLRHDLSAHGDLVSEHIGLKNVSQRLAILFGARASLEIESTRGTGTSLTVVVPRTTSLETLRLRMGDAG